MEKIALVVRFWGKSPSDLGTLEAFLLETNSLCSEAFVRIVLVNEEADRSGAVDYLSAHHDGSTITLPIDPYSTTGALNASLVRAAQAGATHVLFTSTEFPPQKATINALRAHMTDETLVVGARFDDHWFYAGETTKGNGCTVPWNTTALWNLSYLARTGFQLIGDSLIEPVHALDEETATIAVLQLLFPRLKAKVIDLPWFKGSWQDTSTWSSERLARHEHKLALRLERTLFHLAELGLSNQDVPRVEHLVDQEARFENDRRSFHESVTELSLCAA